DRQVVAAAAEQVVRPDPDVDVQVARGTAAHAGLTAAGQPDPLSVLYPGRDTDVEPAGLGHATGAPALRALVRHHRARTLALAARFGEAERPLVAGDQPRPAAPRARAGSRTRPGAATAARVAHAR